MKENGAEKITRNLKKTNGTEDLKMGKIIEET